MSAFDSSIDSHWQTTQRSSRGDGARARLQRRVGQDLVGLHRQRRQRREAEREDEEQRGACYSAGSAAGGAARRAGAPTR